MKADRTKVPEDRPMTSVQTKRQGGMPEPQTGADQTDAKQQRDSADADAEAHPS